MEKGDAVRARDDVLNRLGGHVAALSETAPVRIGFGKIDSAPVGPPASTVAPPPSTLVFTQGSAQGMANSSLSGNGSFGPIPSQLSAMPTTMPTPVADTSTAHDMHGTDHPSEHSALPTRALWIGSIPGTTSSSALLQIFSPFGPVESARVLMHKVGAIFRYLLVSAKQSIRLVDSSTLRDWTLQCPLETP